MKSQKKAILQKESIDRYVIRYDQNEPEVICEEIQEKKIREFQKSVEEKEELSFIEAITEKCPQLASKLVELAIELTKIIPR